MFNLRLWKFAFVIAGVLIFAATSITTAVYAQDDGQGQKERPLGWEKGGKEGWKGGVPPGQEETGVSPGWERGEKEGWFSDVPPGLAKREGWAAPGWSEGEKEGWKNSFPPGWEKKNQKEQEDWKENLRSAKDFIKEKGKKAIFSQEEIEQVSSSLETASRAGVPIENTKDIVGTAIDKGLRGLAIEKLTRAVSYGVDREVDFNQLGKFVNEKLDAGLKGEELVLEVYKEAQRRQEEKKNRQSE